MDAVWWVFLFIYLKFTSDKTNNFVNYLITANNVKPGRLRAMGFSDRWPFGVSLMDMRASKDGQPLVDEAYIKEFNNTPEKKSKNRRIKIVFTPS